MIQGVHHKQDREKKKKKQNIQDTSTLQFPCFPDVKG